MEQDEELRQGLGLDPKKNNEVPRDDRTHIWQDRSGSYPQVWMGHIHTMVWAISTPRSGPYPQVAGICVHGVRAYGLTSRPCLQHLRTVSGVRILAGLGLELGVTVLVGLGLRLGFGVTVLVGLGLGLGLKVIVLVGVGLGLGLGVRVLILTM